MNNTGHKSTGLDKFWKSQSCIYNYKDNLNGTTNRSYIEIQDSHYS